LAIKAARLEAYLNANDRDKSIIDTILKQRCVLRAKPWKKRP
jgi:hypothetical protein